MKQLYRIFTSWFICLFLVLSLSITSFADVNDLMIGSSSNALMTLDLNDDDYGITTFSSLASVDNTVNFAPSLVTFIDRSNGYNFVGSAALDSNGNFDYIVPNGSTVTSMRLVLNRGSLPVTGKYLNEVDFSSDFANDVTRVFLGQQWKSNNVKAEGKNIELNSSLWSQYSGDVYLTFVLDLQSNLNQLIYELCFDEPVVAKGGIGGQFSVSFSVTDMDADFTSVGNGPSEQEYQGNVSSSLSDLSSSVDEVSDEIGFVAEAIQNLQGAMEPHYNNVLTQLHHITEQLHAFYDQIYNNIHLKEYALWQDIKTAIENIDLEVNVNLDKLKTSIDNMSQAVQNKLQSVGDTITNGYDNSSIQNENNELSGAVNELDQAEKEVLDDVTGYIEGFEYPTFENLSGGLLGAIAFFGGFLQSVFLAMGDFGLIITFSLTMIFVLIIVGYHRIRT